MDSNQYWYYIASCYTAHKGDKLDQARITSADYEGKALHEEGQDNAFPGIYC